MRERDQVGKNVSSRCLRKEKGPRVEADPKAGGSGAGLGRDGPRERIRQNWSAEMTSPLVRVTRARRVTRLMLSLRNRTLPSPIRTLTPPEWYENSSSLAPALLPAVRPMAP